MPPPKPEEAEKDADDSAESERAAVRHAFDGANAVKLRPAGYSPLGIPDQIDRDGKQQDRKDRIEDTRRNVQRDHRAENTGRKSPQRDEQSDLQMHSLVEQVRQRAAGTICDDQYERRAGRVGRRESQEDP